MAEFFLDMVDDEFGIINDMGTAPIIAAMTEVLGIPNAINKFLGAPDPRQIVDTGTAIKALIINMLYGRTPLVHVEESFNHIDCEVLFGKGLCASDFNDDCLGGALEDIGNTDFHKLYSEICMHSLELHNALAEQIHVDTTNVSVYGEYASAGTEDFNVTFGDPKSKRKNLKQLNIGLFVQQNGLPLGGNALSGNKSDVKWFREALEELGNVFSGDMYTMPICIFDAAGSNQDMFEKANDQVVPTIIRLSDRFNMTGEHIGKAWEEEQWTIVKKSGEVLETDMDKNIYKLRSFDISIGEYPWRLIVVYSSELEAVKESTARRNFPKRKEKLEKESKKLSNIGFKTIEEANQAGINFIKKNIGLASPFKYAISIAEKTNEKYAKRGKPGKSSNKIITIGYHVQIVIGERDEDLYKEWLKQESCFVLVSNTPKDRCTDHELFKEYKQQWIVEDKFKFLKQPLILGPIWLQKQERIKGLVFVLLLAVLVSMYICYRCMISLQAKPEKTPETSTDKGKCASNNIDESHVVNGNCLDCVSIVTVDETKKPSIVNNEINNKASQSQKFTIINKRLLTSDGRLVERPTFKIIKKLLDPVKTVIKFDVDGNIVRKFVHGTKGRLLELVVMVGFNPMIYLEEYSPKMNLWECNVT